MLFDDDDDVAFPFFNDDDVAFAFFDDDDDRVEAMGVGVAFGFNNFVDDVSGDLGIIDVGFFFVSNFVGFT